MRLIACVAISLVSFILMAGDFRPGDLLFQLSGTSDFSDAITSATHRNQEDSLSFVHVGILSFGEDGKPYVVEASPSNGVQIVPLDSFLCGSPKIGNKPGVIVKRINRDFPREKAIERALSFIGEPYDWYFLPDNGKKYCTELVYDSYLEDNGTPIFKSQPMNFRDQHGEMPEFWIDLYKGLGVDVPEGLPGTNPNSMAREECLVEVYRYF